VRPGILGEGEREEEGGRLWVIYWKGNTRWILVVGGKEGTCRRNIKNKKSSVEGRKLGDKERKEKKKKKQLSGINVGSADRS